MANAALILLLGLAACSLPEANAPGNAAAGDPAGWRFASGRPPSGTEYAAVVASCRDGAILGAAGRPLDACLADLGLHRAD